MTLYSVLQHYDDPVSFPYCNLHDVTWVVGEHGAAAHAAPHALGVVLVGVRGHGQGLEDASPDVMM